MKLPLTILLLPVLGALTGGILRLATKPSLAATRHDRTAQQRIAMTPAAEQGPLPQGDQEPTTPVQVDVAALAALRELELYNEAIRVGAHLSTADFAAFFHKITENSDVEDLSEEVTSNALRFLGRKWLKRDSAGLLAWLDQHAGLAGSRHGWPVALLTSVWAEQDPWAAIRWGKQQGGLKHMPWAFYDVPNLTAEMRLELEASLSEQDILELVKLAPQRLAAVLATQTWGNARDDATLLRAWRQTDAAAADAWLGSLPLARQRRVELSLLEGQDFPAIQAKLNTAPPGTYRVQLATMAVNKLAETDLPAALAFAKANLSGPDRINKEADLLMALGETDPRARDAGLRALGWPQRADSVLVEMAEKDPAAAFREVASAGWHSMGWRMGEALASWAKKSPQEAFAWAETAPESLRQDALQAASQVMEQATPDAIHAQAMSLPAGAARATLLELEMRQTAQREPQAFLTRLGALPPETQTAALAASFPEMWRLEDQRTALLTQMATCTHPTPGQLAGFTASLQEMPAAERLPLLETLPAAFLQDAQWNHLSAALAAASPHEASDWVTRLPAGPRRDQAISGMLNAISDDGEPAAAWIWTGEIQDPFLREEARHTTALRWLKEQPAVAREAIENDPSLSTTLRAELFP
jgi:hypothetical protein